MTIACGHCGDRHETVAEVRRCSASTEPVEDQPSAAVAPERTDRPAPPTDLSGRTWVQLAGPKELGRSLIVTPGQAVPEPWADAPRLEQSDPDWPGRVVEAWTNRRRCVFALEKADDDDPIVIDLPYWDWDPHMELGDERAGALLMANSIDARDVGRPQFEPVTRAVAAGATLAPESTDGDVVTPAGESVWCDGGPLSFVQLAHPIIPALHLERGLLRSVGEQQPSADLAPDQLAAVAHDGGGARIIAPAGSGKTRVLTERARHLFHDRSIDPGALCLVAFNVRARREMEERTTDLAGLQVRTLNSLALAIVNGSGPFLATGPPRAVIEERDVRRILEGLVSTRRVAMSDPFASWVEALSASRLGLRSPAEVETEFAGDVKDFPSVSARYREHLADHRLLDFDEQVIAAIELLLTEPTVRATARHACRLLLVDEFQDLTPAHVLLLRLLAGPTAEVFGVGDDDQTIYGYAGASPDWLIDFDELFPGAGQHDLHTNYRCPVDVIRAADNVLSHNRRRVPKTIEPGPDARSTGLLVEQADHPIARLVEHVEKLRAGGSESADIAVLTRVNATLLGPMVALAEAGIPLVRPVGPSFLDRTGVGAALSWLRIATAPAERLPADALAVAARRPPRALSRRMVEWIAEKQSVTAIGAMTNRLRDERDCDKVAALVDDLERVRELAGDATTREMLIAIRDEIGLGAALDRRLDSSRRAVDRSAHSDDLAALISIAELEPDPAAFPTWLANRLAQLVDDPDGVQLATVHRVKGREWPHVVLYEASAGLFPHRLSNDREEERRVFHVGLTRGAASVLVLSGEQPSPFVAELTERFDPTTAPEPAVGPDEAKPSAVAARSAPPVDGLAESRLRESLKAWRLERARADDVPAYVVFNDATLHELARMRPDDVRALLAVSGIGPAKAERYGPAILAIIDESQRDAD